MKNIYLIGIMGCGKTSVGKILANDLNLEFCDMDKMIEDDEKRTINDIFAKDGEGVFRDIETNTLKKIADMENMIVSTGGGVILKPENVEIMKNSGTVIWIKRNISDIVNKVDHDARPLIKNDPDKLFEIFEKRKELYEKSSDVKINNNGSITRTVNDIKEIIKCG